jgi:hypothetical protein
MRISPSYLLLVLPAVSLPNTFAFTSSNLSVQSLHQKAVSLSTNLEPALSLGRARAQHQHQQPSNSRRSNVQPLFAIPTLDNWFISFRGEAIGVVSDHPDPNILDGELLTTSRLSIGRGQAKEGETVVTASGSKYKLGIAKGAKRKPTPPVTAPTKSSNGFNFSNPFSGGGSSKRAPILNDWTVSSRGEVTGTARNHPDSTVANGDVLTTSKIKEQVKDLKEGMTVSTVTGSKYLLGRRQEVRDSGRNRGGSSSASSESKPGFNPMGTFAILNKQFTDSMSNLNKGPTKSTPSPSVKAPPPSSRQSVKEEADRITRMRDIRLEYGINGKTVGDGRYLLCGKPKRSTSGKSNIWGAYRADEDGMPFGEKLTIKISPNFEAIQREDENYNRVCSGLFQGRFVEKTEFLPNTGGDSKDFASTCALVIESGRKDLKSLLSERNGRGFEGRAMRDAASAALQCIQAMHSSGLVWTDLKTENFVIVSDEIGDNGVLPGVKGIDLESAMPRRDNPVDFSPEACPPEFATAFIAGEGLDFRLDYSYDIWSFGMMMYELTTGRSYFGNKTPAQITKSLQYGIFVANVSDVSDPKLKDLIKQCLQTNPRKRPSATNLLLHPYFITSGFGPFGF